MSDAVIVALIAASPAIVSSWLGFLNKRDIRKAATLVAKAAVVGEKAAALGERNEKHLAETKDAMMELAINTNSVKDELVKVTAQASRAQGNLEGRAQQKAESKDTEEHSG